MRELWNTPGFRIFLSVLVFALALSGYRRAAFCTAVITGMGAREPMEIVEANDQNRPGESGGGTAFKDGNVLKGL